MVNHRPFVYILFSYKTLIQDLPKSHIYNHQSSVLLPRTVEHIIPRRLFYEKQEANDIHNLAFCDAYTNSRRSDYKFGDYRTISPDLLRYEYVKPVFDPKCKTLTGYIDPSKRIFYPGSQSDFGLIARSIIYMLSNYPYLYSNLDEIIEHPHLLTAWSKYPILSYEKYRNEKK